MAGEFTAGLSGGQRKLLLFELIYQRTKDQSDLLLVLDEPFAGVTDDFVPFVTSRLNAMRRRHNILLVTNDHVSVLTKMADNTIRVSAIDRTHVAINDNPKVDREKAILALSLGDDYEYQATGADLKFFFDVEVRNNKDLLAIVIFTVFSFGLFTVTFWNSASENAALVLIGGGLVAFFCVNPYYLALVEWRNAMLEEAEALMHASATLNKNLKAILTIVLLLVISLIEFGLVNAVIEGLEEWKFWVGIFFDSFSVTVPLVFFGIYTKLPFQTADILGSMPFLLMIFLSTTFSPGAGVPVLKELRYAFTRFYFWCMVPGVQDLMEGCPNENLNFILLIVTGSMGLVFAIIAYPLVVGFLGRNKMRAVASKRKSLMDKEFQDLQIALYGERALRGKSTHGDDTDSDGSPPDTTTYMEPAYRYQGGVEVEYDEDNVTELEAVC